MVGVKTWSARYVAVVAAALVSACGGGGGGGGGGNGGGVVALSGAVVKGPVSGARLCAFSVSQGAVGAQILLEKRADAAGTMDGGCYVTPIDGSYAVLLPAGTRGDVLFRTSGGRFCADESVARDGVCEDGTQPVDLRASDELMALLDVTPDTAMPAVYLTPLSTAAVESAATSTLSAAQAARALRALSEKLSPGEEIQLSTPPNQPYLQVTAAFLASGGSLGDALGTLAQGSTDFTPKRVASTAHKAFKSTYHDVQFVHGDGVGCGNRCSFDEGEELKIFLGPLDGLFFPTPYFLLKNPFYEKGSSPTELIWRSLSNVEYVLTDNQSGIFKGITVRDAERLDGPGGTPRVLGYFQVRDAKRSQVLANFVGTHNIARQYVGPDLALSTLELTAEGGLRLLEAGLPRLDLKPWEVWSVENKLACCGRVDVYSSRKLEVAGQPVAFISLYANMDGGLKDVELRSGAQSGVVGWSIGYSMPLPLHTGAALPVDSRISGTVGNTLLDLVVTRFSSVSTTEGFTITGEAYGGTPNTQQKELTLAFPGEVRVGQTVACSTGSREAYVRAKASSDEATVLRSRSGGDCFITISELQTLGTTITGVAGTFVAEIYQDARGADGPVMLRDGVFRWTAPQ